MTLRLLLLLALLGAGCQAKESTSTVDGVMDETAAIRQAMEQVSLRCEQGRMHLYVNDQPQESLEGLAVEIRPLANLDQGVQVYMNICEKQTVVRFP